MLPTQLHFMYVFKVKTLSKKNPRQMGKFNSLTENLVTFQMEKHADLQSYHGSEGLVK